MLLNVGTLTLNFRSEARLGGADVKFVRVSNLSDGDLVFSCVPTRARFDVAAGVAFAGFFFFCAFCSNRKSFSAF